MVCGAFMKYPISQSKRGHMCLDSLSFLRYRFLHYVLNEASNKHKSIFSPKVESWCKSSISSKWLLIPVSLADHWNRQIVNQMLCNLIDAHDTSQAPNRRADRMWIRAHTKCTRHCVGSSYAPRVILTSPNSMSQLAVGHGTNCNRHLSWLGNCWPKGNNLNESLCILISADATVLGYLLCSQGNLASLFEESASSYW